MKEGASTTKVSSVRLGSSSVCCTAACAAAAAAAAAAAWAAWAALFRCWGAMMVAPPAIVCGAGEPLLLFKTLLLLPNDVRCPPEDV